MNLEQQLLGQNKQGVLEKKESILEGTPVENKEVNNKIKEGVSFVFEQNPELSTIGTEEQYSLYVDTIFPDSKFKDIVYHGTNIHLDEFKFRSLGLTSSHFISNKEFAKLWANERVVSRGEGSPEVYAFVVNILDNEDDYYGGSITRYDNAGDVTGKEITVYREEDAHLLGSKQDMGKFKKFTSGEENVL